MLRVIQVKLVFGPSMVNTSTRLLFSKQTEPNTWYENIILVTPTTLSMQMGSIHLSLHMISWVVPFQTRMHISMGLHVSPEYEFEISVSLASL
jgi:hypothetical protein